MNCYLSELEDGSMWSKEGLPVSPPLSWWRHPRLSLQPFSFCLLLRKNKGPDLEAMKILNYQSLGSYLGIQLSVWRRIWNALISHFDSGGHISPCAYRTFKMHLQSTYILPGTWKIKTPQHAVWPASVWIPVLLFLAWVCWVYWCCKTLVILSLIWGKHSPSPKGGKSGWVWRA